MEALITLRNAKMNFGTQSVLDNTNLVIHSNERICIVGRNGEGKSSLLKVINGVYILDGGEVVIKNNLTIESLSQEVPDDISGTIFKVVLSGLGELGLLLAEYEQVLHDIATDETAMDRMYLLQEKIEKANAWNTQQQVENTLSVLGLSGDDLFEKLSGGMKRRVLFARSLVSSPDILLLDEPTNHLDIESIKWLESFLPQFSGTLIFISHDRAFAQSLATRIVELDRGCLTSFIGTYQAYLDDKEKRAEDEEKQNALFDKKLAQEEVWIRQGVKARRTRNEGRVRSLESLRKQRQNRVSKQSKVSVEINMAGKTGQKVITAENISMNFKDRMLFKPFNLEIVKGDKIAILGPNGCGKSTLLNILLGKLSPTTGNVDLGTNLEIAYFDQMRGELDQNLSAEENIGSGSQWVDIAGKKTHVLSYLQKFLFSPERSRSPITRFSGGERNRLLLAKLFSQPSNLLILDEPTNDLDIETLEVLEDLVVNYTGTILLVSHDRSFINNVVSSTLAFEDDEIHEYIGGYDDWLAQKDIKDSLNNKVQIDKNNSKKDVKKSKKS